MNERHIERTTQMRREERTGKNQLTKKDNVEKGRRSYYDENITNRSLVLYVGTEWFQTMLLVKMVKVLSCL